MVEVLILLGRQDERQSALDKRLLNMENRMLNIVNQVNDLSRGKGFVLEGK